MGISLRPWPEDERALSDADLWDKKVTEGMPEGDATTYVETRRQRQVQGTLGGLEKAAPRAGTMLPGKRTAALAQGATFNTSDELLGALRTPATRRVLFQSLLSRGGNVPVTPEAARDYEQGVAAERRTLNDFRAEAPLASLGYEIGGAVTGGLLTSALTGGATASSAIPQLQRVPQLLRLAAAGAASGAAAGAGGAEEGGRLRGAVVGGVMGGVATPAIARGGSYVADALNLRGRLSPVANAIWTRLRGADAPEALATPAAPRALPSGTGPRLLGSGQPAAPGAQATPPNAATQRLASLVSRARQAVAGSAPPVSSNRSRAAELVLRDLQADNMSVDALEAAAQRANPAIPAAVFNLAPAGGNVVGRARTAQSFPGPGQTTLATRTLAQVQDAPEGMLNALEQRSGVGAANVPQLLEGMDALRAREADALMDVVRSVGTVDDPRVAQLLEAPIVRKAFDRVAADARNRRVNFPRLVEEAIPEQPGTAVVRAGQPLPPRPEPGTRWRLSRPATAGELEQVKRALDDLRRLGERSPLDAGGLTGQEQATYRQLVGELIGVLDDATTNETGASAYRTMRERFAAQSRAMEALNDGRTRFLTGRLDELQAHLATLAPAEREAWQVGAMQAAREQVMRNADRPGSATNLMGVSPESLARQRMAALFGDNTEGLMAAVDDADLWRRITGDRNVVVGGSPTARLGAAQDDQLTDVVEAGMAVAQGNTGGLLQRALRSGLAARARGLNRDLNAELADLLSAGSGGSGRGREAELADLLRLLRETQARQARPTRGTRAARGIAQGTAGRAGEL